MQHKRYLLFFLLFLPFLYSCNKELNVNADWTDITVVYGILSQNDDTTFIKITKAFLGPGDAMQFAKVPDSSTYPDKLEVKLEEWSDNTLVQTFSFDTITIHTKEAGDSIFYYPDQLVYYSPTGRLDENNTYKLTITNKKTGKVITSQTKLVHTFKVEIPDPDAPVRITEYFPGQNFTVKWDPATGGKRYQLLIRFHYLETRSSGSVEKSIDWLLFNNVQVEDPYEFNPQPIVRTFAGETFYTFLESNIPVDPTIISRAARRVDYIFSVASEDLNTYMEVTEPSMTIIQERPTFSNITNGIGLFSSRFVNEIDSFSLTQRTIDELHVNVHTAPLGF
jgi:hypothetical protein